MNAKNLIGGFITGAALGAAAALLLAPASGEKTRRKIAKGSMKVKKNVVDYVETSIESLRSQFNKKIDQATGKIDQATGRVKETAKEAVNYGADKAEAFAAKARNHG